MTHLKIVIFFIFISFISVAQSTQELLKKATEKEEKALYEEANQILEQLSSQAKESKDWQNYMFARTQKAHNLLKSNKLEASLDWINQNLNELENPAIEKAFFWKMKNNLLTAEVLLTFGQYEKVKNTLKTIIEQLEKEKEESLLADSYNLLGILYWQEGNNTLALSYLEKSLSLREKNALAVQMAASYNDLGLVYQRTDVQKALYFYQKAFTIYQQSYPENHPKIAVAYANIGIAQKTLKEYVKSEEAFKKALSIWKNMYPEGHPNEAFNLNNLGSLALEEKKYKEAIAYHKQALSLYQKFYKERHPEIAGTYNLIATAFLANNDFKQALYNVHLAVVNNTLNFQSEDTSKNPAIAEVLSHNIFLYSLFLKSDILEQRYVSQSIRLSDLKTALSAVSTADTLLGKIRQNANNQADKLFLGQISAQLYEKGIRLCYLLANEAKQAKKYYPQAFYFSEKAKAIVLLEAISESKAKDFGNIPPNLLKEETDLKSRITFLEQQIALKPEESLLKQYKNELFELNR
ncbi:MAG: tetratricopeptide repeat protein, partial [Thermonemataceae bacterium]|nr:tetratricopeptide repeat protein [Thermonemataceae bacterium]